MAEIPIQHKPRRRTTVWPWVIGALVILLVVWGLTMYHRGNSNTAVVPADTATAAGEVSRPIDTMRATPFDTSTRATPFDTARRATAFDTTINRPIDTITRRRP